MVPQTPDEIVAAAIAKLADVERRLAADAATLSDDDRHRGGVERLAALRRAADELREELDRSTDR